jgi:RimJ/RimL family protein N-acetyltransferase
LHEFNNDLETELAGGGDPPTPQSLARLQAEFDQEAAKGGRDGMRFAIEAGTEFIGHCALFNVNSTAHICELGITVGDKKFWGKGYGSESIRLLVQYAFRYQNFRKVWLHVHAANERAVRAYQSCGFVEEGRLRAHVWSDGAYDDVLLMGLLREEWQATKAAKPPA